MASAAAHDTDWAEANKRCLMAELALVRRALEHHAGGGPASDGASERDCQGAGSLFAEAEAALPAPSALSHLCRAFALSRFERSVLLLAAGVELDASFAGACALAQGGRQRPFPTFGLALAALPEPHWDALAPSAPLRRWRMLEPAAGENLVDARLRIDERILHHLTGISYLDERLQGLIQPLGSAAGLLPSQEECAERTAAILQRHHEKQRLPVINLCGLDPTDLRAVAACACSRLGLRAFLLEAAGIPGSPTERDAFARLWEREAILSQAGLILAADEGQACRDFLDMLGGVLLVASRDPLGSSSRLVVRLDVAGPSVAEQRQLWQAALPKGPEALNGALDRVVAHFRLSSRAIQSACAQLEETSAAGSSDSPARRLWTACRVQARQRLDELAQRLEPAARWEDIVLPDRHLHTLREIAAQVRHRTTVYHTWGFARKCPRGLGITALFAGPSGTGKTMAAEVLANELQLDLYHIDLSQVVSKYIGETEKNLKRVFDAAEEGGAILLFDEADALFGKRSEIKDSHDRYANIEVGYLLQRMEAYRGLAILTTNQKSALDDAFQRRIRFMINFSFPDAALRAEIWRRIFPEETPTEKLEAGKLARLNVSGGIIRNIALHAAFLAAESGGPVRMTEILQAARSVYTRLERPLNETEIRGWM